MFFVGSAVGSDITYRVRKGEGDDVGISDGWNVG